MLIPSTIEDHGYIIILGILFASIDIHVQEISVLEMCPINVTIYF